MTYGNEDYARRRRQRGADRYPYRADRSAYPIVPAWRLSKLPRRDAVRDGVDALHLLVVRSQAHKDVRRKLVILFGNLTHLEAKPW
jgi:hypothetical protein